MIRRVIFWSLFTLLVAAIAFFDSEAIFVYLPRWFVVVPVILLLVPVVTRSTIKQRGLAILFVIVLPYLIAPLRWGEHKSFFMDCKSLSQGMQISKALIIMAPYKENVSEWSNASISGVIETAEERKNRIIFIPSEKDQADQCVLYPLNDVLTRIVVSPD